MKEWQKEWQKRVLVEKEELLVKTNNLTTYLANARDLELSIASELRSQLFFMENYLNILDIRISRFTTSMLADEKK